MYNKEDNENVSIQFDYNKESTNYRNKIINWRLLSMNYKFL